MRQEAILKTKIAKLQESERFLTRRHIIILLLLRRISTLQDEVESAEEKLAIAVNIANQIINQDS